ncbi:MAG: RecX family transcriptional regulator [Erysipelotrichales bacterium]|nr:RecX family transcriptional regulator [Erysipelotrichales bacterium]
MRIGLFSDTYAPEVNGVVTSIVTLQKELEKHGHEVFVVTTAQSAIHIQKDGNILRLPGVELKKLYGYRMSGPFSVIGLADIRAMKLDLIHVHTEFGIGTFARIVSKMLNIPLVATYHTMYEDYTHYFNPVQSKTIDKTLKNIVSGWSQVYGDMCNELIAPSEKTKDRLIDYGVDRPIHVIPTGLDLSRFYHDNFTDKEREDLRTSLGIANDRTMLLFVGRIAEEKSIDVILKAMKVVKEKNLPITCVIVGGGPALDMYKEMAATLDITDVVVFTGKVVPADVPLYYSATNLFVSASLSETQGLTFIEAMASSNIVFAAERNILADLITEDESGYYFDTADELVTKIEHHLNKSEDGQVAVANAAFERVKPYDSSFFYNSIIRVYESAITSTKDVFIVENVKLKNNNYFVVECKSATEEYELLLKLETYYDSNIQKGKTIPRKQIDEYIKESIYNRAYVAAIKFMATKDRTRKEMYDFLCQKTELDIKSINDMIDGFENSDYIDDERYVEHEIESMKVSLFGRKKIIADLVKKGIPYEMVQDKLADETDDFYIESAVKVIENTLPSMVSKNTNKTKLLIQQKLERMGYNNGIIYEAMRNFEFEKSSEIELALLSKEYEKQYERLAKKYSGYELKSKLITTLIRKGFEYSQVDEMIKERNDGFEAD